MTCYYVDIAANFNASIYTRFSAILFFTVIKKFDVIFLRLWLVFLFQVAWIHIDRQMILTIHRHVISRVPRFSVSHDNAKTWLLHVSSAQQEDRGYYMCQVNTNPMISQVGYLQVVVPPNILDTDSTQSTVAIRENQNISLTCKAEGFPTPKIMWRREDGQGISVDRKKKGTSKSSLKKSIITYPSRLIFIPHTTLISISIIKIYWRINYLIQLVRIALPPNLRIFIQ